MGKLVQVLPGFSSVALPPFNLYFGAGQSTTLTDAEYAGLTTSTTRALTVTGNPADPTRSGSSGPPNSLQDAVNVAVAQAKAYTDAATSTGVTRLGVTTQTGSQTLTTSAQALQLCNATGGAFNVTLPTGAGAGLEFTIKKIDSSANAITVVGTIDGATNYSLATQWKYISLVSSATSGVWYIVANN